MKISIEYVVLDTNSSGESSLSSRCRSVASGLLAKNAFENEPRLLVIRGGTGMDVGHLHGNIMELVTKGLQKVLELCFNQE